MGFDKTDQRKPFKGITADLSPSKGVIKKQANTTVLQRDRPSRLCFHLTDADNSQNSSEITEITSTYCFDTQDDQPHFSVVTLKKIRMSITAISSSRQHSSL